MEYAIPIVNPYPPSQSHNYWATFNQNTHDMYATNSWISMLSCLHSQKGYLNGLLSKTAITLNALRERQTRNDRALSMNPTPRAKRKKIQQNRWRTGKTIQTCENEERVILDCLQVCDSNINTLEAMVNPGAPSSTAVGWAPSNSLESDTGSLHWGGWTDEEPISPFVKNRVRSLPADDIPPETRLDKNRPSDLLPQPTRHAPPLPILPQGGPATLLPPVPPNTAVGRSDLSPEAVVFVPNVSQDLLYGEERSRELDKLSISGLLASKCMLLIQKRRFSDLAIGHLFGKLSSNRPSVSQVRSHQSWASSPKQSYNDEGFIGEPVKRTISA